MRRFLTMSAALVAAIPVGAQGTLMAKFSEGQWREPTFVVSRAAHVAVFELLDGGRIAQRYPRVEAQNEFALPAGETPLSYLDVNIGRLTQEPGTRTVFFNAGGYGVRPVANASAPTAHTMILVSSTAPLRIGPSAEFPAIAAKELEAIDASTERKARALAAVLAAVRPAGSAEVASDVVTMWSVDYREFRGAGTSIAAGDPLPGTHWGGYREGGYYSAGGCGGYGIGVITTQSPEFACGREAVWMGGGWAYDIGAGYVPYLPFYYGDGGRRAPSAPTIENKPYGVFPGSRLTPTGPQGGVVRAPEPPVEQVPAMRGRWGGSIAGSGEVPMGTPVGALNNGGGGGGEAPHAAPTVSRYSGPIFVAPSAPPARAPQGSGAVAVSTPAPILVAPMSAPAAGARGPAPAVSASRPTSGPTPAPVKKQ